jgi:hypothetical protein
MGLGDWVVLILDVSRTFHFIFLALTHPNSMEYMIFHFEYSFAAKFDLLFNSYQVLQDILKLRGSS